MRREILPLAIGATLLSAATSCSTTPQEIKRPNVVLILVDDLGKEWIEQYGAQGVKLPNLQRLADQSILFNNAYSMPQSTPSRAAILTGQYPYNNGWVNHYDVPRWGYGAQLDAENNPCFPRLLRDNGYKTCVAGKWQLNDFRLQPDAMAQVGFDYSFMWTGGESGNTKVSDKRYWDPYIHTDGESKIYEGAFGPDLYSDYILRFIEQNRDEPLFIYYPMTLTHTPFVHTPHAMDATTNYEKHLAMTEYMDYLVGRLMQSLEDNGIMEDTYVIFTTDNGTTVGCVGNLNGHYIRGGKSMLSQSGINCPFMIHIAGQKEGRVSDALVDFTDISATILDITNTPQDPRYHLDGVSFTSVLDGAQQSPKGYALSMGGNPAGIGEDSKIRNQADFRDRAIIGEEYKIYLSMEREIVRIYNIREDRFERHNLVEDKEVMATVLAQFGSIIDQMPTEDANPRYDVLPHDPTLNFDLNKMAGARNIQKQNFRGETTKQEYDEFVSGMAYKR